MEQCLFVFSHVYSQLRYRWPGVPELSLVDSTMLHSSLPKDSELHHLSISDWQDIAGDLRLNFPDVLPWLGSWERESDPDCVRLSKCIHQQIKSTKSEGALYIAYNSPDYPKSLKFIPDPPLAITVTGSCKNLRLPCVSIIGSRKASAFALQESFRLGQILSSRGFLIVSGGAFGCDIAAHEGALASCESPAPTVSVAASGLSRLYPVHNQRVFDRIREAGGNFLSERLWWEGCLPRDFASRNRIISGMSFATCVMQAGMKSGALLTARHSLNHGREVLVLRHPDYDIRADGSRWLQNDGAETFSSADELSLSLSSLLRH